MERLRQIVKYCKREVGSCTMATLPHDAPGAAPGSMVIVQTPDGTYREAWGYADADLMIPMHTDMRVQV